MDLAGDGVDGTTKWHWTKRCIHTRHCHAKVRSELREGRVTAPAILSVPFLTNFLPVPELPYPFTSSQLCIHSHSLAWPIDVKRC